MKPENTIMPNITICVACYNASPFLDKLFYSLDSQTFGQFKIVFIDDGSVDDTYAKILNYQKNSTYNITLKTQKNLGVAATRNLLISLVDTEYFLFLDADDQLPKKAIQIFHNVIQENDYDIVSGRTRVVFNEHIVLPLIITRYYVKNMTAKHYVKANLCNIGGSLFRTNIFKNYHFLENSTFEDLGLLPYLFLKTEKFKMIRNIIYYYHRRGAVNSLSTYSMLNRWKFIDLFEQTKYIIEFYKKDDFLTNPEYISFINGTLYQLLLPLMWFSKNYSNNIKVTNLVLWQTISHLTENGLTLQYPWIFWKSMYYLYFKFHRRYIYIGKYIKNAKNFAKKVALNHDDFCQVSAGKFKKKKIYFLESTAEHNLYNVVTANPKTTFCIDYKYNNEFNKEVFNILFGVKWSQYKSNMQHIHYVDARDLKLIDKATMDKLIAIPKYIIILIGPENIPTHTTEKLLNFVVI